MKLFTMQIIQAVILAAGRGQRMAELTNTMPKPMLALAGKTLIEHKLAILPSFISEVVIVIGYYGDQIKSHFGDSYNGKKINYVTQNVLNGTADALWCAKPLLKDRFIIFNSDDIYHGDDIMRCLSHEHSLLIGEVLWQPKKHEVTFDDEENLIAIRPNDSKEKVVCYVPAGVYVVSQDFFKQEKIILSNGESSLPHTFAACAKNSKIKIVKTTQWHRVTTPEDIKKFLPF